MVLTRVYPFLFLILVFGSLISGPLFINNTPQTGIPVILQALAEESSDGENSDSDEKEEEEKEEEEKEEEEKEEEKEEEEKEEEKEEEECDETDEGTEEEETEEEKCDETYREIEEEETEETDEETDEEKEEETEEEKEEETDRETEEEKEEKKEETKKESANAVADSEEYTLLEEIMSEESLIEVINDETTEPELVSTLSVIKQEQVETDKEIDIVDDSEEYTLLDEILDDESLLKDVISDNTTEVVLGSTLLEIKQEPVQNPSTTEICDNQADDDGDGAIDEYCTVPPTEICGNETDDDGDGTVDEEECVVPPTEICGNETDDDGDGTVDEEECVVPPAEICDNDLDDDADGKTDDADEDDCPAIMPAVEIESAEDEEGEPLSQGDMIAPGEVTFTFSANTDSQENSQDYEFQCALNGESFSSCNSPQTVKMDEGKHTFVVRLAS